MQLLLAAVCGVLTGFATTALALPVLARRAVLDVPNQRSSHAEPTVRGGGIGLATGTLVALAIAYTNFLSASSVALVIAGLGFGAIGLADDLVGSLSPVLRLALQFATASAVVGVVWEHASHELAVTLLVGAAAACWIVSFVNAFNFMDGINGLSCAETIAAGIAFGLVARHEHQYLLQIAAFALVAGSLGFVPFNFPKARAFLGDVGSYFAGAWLAVLVVMGLRGSIPVEAMVAPVALYVADTGMTLVKRVYRHEAWREAHREHTYQRLVDLGWSHSQTTSLVFVVVTLCSILGSVSLFGSVTGRIAADVGVGALIGGYLALPTLVTHHYLLPSVGGRAPRVHR
jgi:UDP-GlcNAc:undecaprenyl-phosphate GlcNAc-1-phosphate transferase